jgi:hypothetical protein
MAQGQFKGPQGHAAGRIAASAKRSSSCICWSLLLICAPQWMAKVLHFTLEPAILNNDFFHPKLKTF